MKKLVLALSALMLTALLAACTVTFVPDEAQPPRSGTTVTATPVGGKIVVVVPTHPRNEQIIYSCSGTRLGVRYLDNYDHAEIFYGGEWNRLNRDRNVSGEVYANNTYQWNADGREGYLQKNGNTVVRECKY